jgi:hypothetical protein
MRHLFGWSRPSVSHALATLLLFFVFAGGAAADPGLKPPPAASAPAPSQAAEPEFYLVPARAIEQVNQLFEGLRREIERLRAVVDKGVCS